MLIYVEMLDSLEESNSAELAELITALIEECDDVNGIWEEEDFKFFLGEQGELYSPCSQV